MNVAYKILAAMLQKRICKFLDPLLMPTQYGFRVGKSTTDAIHIIRRLAHRGFTIQGNMHMVLLDWEKAFDKVTHTGLFEALERMNIAPKLRNLIKQLYKAPVF